MRSTQLLAPPLVALLSGLVHGQDSQIPLAPLENARESNSSLLWGPYRPNLYFGVRPRVPESLIAGLLWSRVEDYQGPQKDFRHTCEQNDGMDGYGWEQYDVRIGGEQLIRDVRNKIDLSTSFVKVESAGAATGGSWGVRIKGKPRDDDAKDVKTTVVFYVANEGEGTMQVTNEEDELGIAGDVHIEGHTKDLGKFELTVTAPEGKNQHPRPMHPSHVDKPLERTIVRSLTESKEEVWQAKNLLFREIKSEIDAYQEKYTEEKMPPPWQIFTVKNEWGSGNLHYVQKVFEGAFEFDVLYSPVVEDKKLTSELLTEHIKSNAKNFVSKFASVFPRSPAFETKKFGRFAKSLFSNLLGGIGYFHGTSLVDRSYAEEYNEADEGFWMEAAEARNRHQEKTEGPSELFTSIPSRPFFPRGFLWDEGFHLLPIMNWDTSVVMEIVRSWFRLIDEDGWIAREQILGAEARSKVPAEFQVQYPHYANPPTLFLTVEAYLDKLIALKQNSSMVPAPGAEEAVSRVMDSLLDASIADQFLTTLYPLLKKHYYWIRKSQAGDFRTYDRPEETAAKEGYRWRGRTETHVLTSGLDDYPRAQPPHPGELNVDLLSWVGAAGRALSKVARYLDTEDSLEEAEVFESQVRNIQKNLVVLHWSKKEKMFCDSTIDAYEEHSLVCHKGYISLFPFLLHLIPQDDSEKLEAVLDLILDPEHLWSPHGLRSLSKQDEKFGKDENYWRGNIWININYLAVRAARYYLQDLNTSTQGQHKSAQQIVLQEKLDRVAKQLNWNVVNTVYKSWEESKFAWEQYDQGTGEGRRTAHFTGWTSMVVAMMEWDAESS